MKAEELAARQLAEQKQAIEEERRKLEMERAAMAATNKAAMNEQVRWFKCELNLTIPQTAV